MKAERNQRSSLLEELRRALRWLVTLFADPEFRAHPPEIVLDPGYPMPEAPLEREACIPLYRHDLLGSPIEILTLLLHKAIHAFHAFRWQQDCTCWSYHTEAFRRQAEQLGFQVAWAGKRYGWAQTRPRHALRHFFEDIALSWPAREGQRPRRRRRWDCGLLRLPDREDLENRLGPRDARPDSRRLVRSLQVHRRGASPMVRLSGRWLAAFGFAQGARLKVDARPGRLVLEARPEVRR